MGLLEARCLARLEEFDVFRFAGRTAADHVEPGGLWHWPIYSGQVTVLDRRGPGGEFAEHPIPCEVVEQCANTLASSILVKGQWVEEVLGVAGEELETFGGLHVLPTCVVGTLAGLVTDVFLPLSKVEERRRVGQRLFTQIAGNVTDKRWLAERTAALVNNTTIRAPSERAIRAAFDDHRDLFPFLPEDPDLTPEEVMELMGDGPPPLAFPDADGTRMNATSFAVDRDGPDWVLALPRGRRAQIRVRFRRRCEAELLAAVLRLATALEP